MPKISVHCYALLVVGIVLSYVSQTSLAINQQQKDRFIEYSWAPNEPVSIVGLKNERTTLEIGSTFQDDNNWLKGFTLNLTNIYHKPIQYVSVELKFPRSHNQLTPTSDPPVADNLTYGRNPSMPDSACSPGSGEVKLIKPGETVILTMSETELAGLWLLLNKRKYSQSIVRIQLRLEDVDFDDGTKWKAGLFFRRDANNPENWVPIQATPTPGQL